MRIARVAIFAGELASPIGIDGPLERHAIGITLIQDRAHGQQEILRSLLRRARSFGTRRRGCEAGYANQRRFGISSLAIEAALSVACGHRLRNSRSRSRTRRGAIRRLGVTRNRTTGTDRDRGKITASHLFWALRIRACGEQSGL